VVEQKSEDWSPAELIKAGWRDSDLAWECAARATVQGIAEGKPDEAAEAAALSLRIARESFAGDDPRLGTSLANHAACLGPAGKEATARTLLTEARSVWANCDSWIGKMTAPRSARSSMFHMRMEQLHRETYEARWREKWNEWASDARARLAAAGSLDATAAIDALGRWRRECPAMLNDTRKLMAAAMLLAAS
jgi:hypothetical protein